MGQLLDAIMRRTRADLAAHRWEGLRPSHLRLLEAVEPAGSRITALAESLGMTKQGCGQLVTALVRASLVEVALDPGDRRARVVRPTARGNEVSGEVDDAFRVLERSWAAQVGAQRYEELRSMLIELSRPNPLPPP